MFMQTLRTLALLLYPAARLPAAPPPQRGEIILTPPLTPASDSHLPVHPHSYQTGFPKAHSERVPP